MDIKKTLDLLSLSNNVVGLGGCKSHGTTLECCEYNLTVFDEKNSKDEIHVIGDDIVKIHHGKLDESNSDVLILYDNMSALSDPEWNLKIFLSKIKEKSDKIRNSCIKNHLIDSAFYATKAKQGLSDPFAPCWLKCAAYSIADALVLYNGKSYSPTHALESIRKFKKNKANESLSVIADVIGLERATPSLLSRMLKSTVGFSDMVEANENSRIIQRKYEYFVNDSLLSDCYFYLGYMNRNILVSIRDTIHKKPELIHVLKTALDIEHDITKTEQFASNIHKLSHDLTNLLSGHA
ncbi:hypothetical protein QVH35_06325 [Candidatus Nitrosotenuis chungbukensis]|uniref:hypothetical protein n=1 Tax=Candidatus Nitrosotenuis chungbukensis TaxID=1353246 RepID=UPI0005B280C3|nr:hypothetical protein [Candidatus Nitrosotenuis chungbukensis]WKT57079.1 hypothetical protein QVH35_06325 [Candidatus Nitrosotenuis chungbukensis]